MRGLETRKAQEHVGRTPGMVTELPWDLEVRGAVGRWQLSPRGAMAAGAEGGGWVAASRCRCVRAAAQCVAATVPRLLQLQSGSTHPNRRLGVPGSPHMAPTALVPPAPGPCPSAVPGLCASPAQAHAGAAHEAEAVIASAGICVPAV